MEVFVKYLLLHQGYFGMDYSPAFLDLPPPPPIMPYVPFNM